MPAQIVKKHDKVCRCRTGTDYLQVSAACLTAPILHDITYVCAAPDCRLGQDCPCIALVCNHQEHCPCCTLLEDFLRF